MSLRKTLSKKKSVESPNNDIPVWVTQGSDTTIELFSSTIEEKGKILDRIKQGESLNKKSRSIIISRVASLANKDRSTLSARRQPELYEYIKNINNELEQIYHRTISGNIIRKRSTREELEKEIKKLKSQAKSFNEGTRRAIVEELFNSNLLENHDKLARDVTNKEKKIQELTIKNNNLQENNARMLTEIASLYEMLNSRQRAKLKGLSLINTNM